MLRGMRHMLEDYETGKFTKEELDEKRFSYLDTADIPDPDLMIRTSGEQRLSNYLMWQHAYSEFYFTDTPWPDFHREDLVKALEAYTSRDRRYGKVKES
ncbi:MAG: undecaprenyl diphosphate synthase family protein [Eubacterium sp.]